MARRRSIAVPWLSGLTALAAAAATLAPLPAAAATRATTHLVAHAAPATAYRSSLVVVTGTAKPAVTGLAVSLQRYDGHRWATVAHAKETRTGAFTLRVKAAKKPVRLVLRVVRSATKHVKAGVGATLHVRVVALQFTVKAKPAAAQAPYGGPIVVTGSVAAKTTGGVLLQRLVAGQWKTLAKGKLAKNSTFRISTVQPGGSYVLRVFKPWTTKVASGASKRFTVTVIPTLAVSSATLPTAAAHLPYTGSLAAQGGIAPYTWSLSTGVLPTGMSFSSTGVVTGRPSVPSSTPLTVTVHDAAGHVATAASTLTVGWSPGTISAWGGNDLGQLADGIRPDRDTAAQVPGISGASVITANWRTAYALVAGGVLAWGVGDFGQLGNGTTGGYADAPVPVTGLTSGVTAISAKEFTAYALKSDGTVWAWGDGTYGQLGNGTSAASSVPVQVSGLTGITRIAAGAGAGYALKSDGTVWAWGYNLYGGLGDGTTVSRLTPVQVTGLSAGVVIRIAGGALDGYALKADGTVWAWGYNSSGQVGDGTTTTRTAAVQVTGVTGASGVWAGFGQVYALKSDNTVYTWGGGTEGQLGNGAALDAPTPVKVTISGVLALGGGTSDGYAVLSDHTVRSWGSNDAGQLGNGTTVDSTLPVTATGLSNISMVVGGLSMAYALRSTDGSVWSWGYDLFAYRDRSAAQPVTGLGPVVAVETDSGGGAAIKADGTVWDWGGGYLGQLGDGTTSRQTDVPVQVSGLTAVVAVSGNHSTRLAVRADGTVWAWGDNPDGEFGVATPGSHSTPVQVPGISGVTSISAGGRTVYAVKADGTVWAWGSGFAGQLGNGAFADSPTPVQVTGLSGIIQVAGGDEDGYALTADGGVFAWGAGDVGQLGHTALLNISVPALVPGLTGVISIAAGDNSAYAVRSDGTAVAWGDNTYGKLGNGTMTDAHTPVAMTGVTTALSAAAGWDNGYLLLANGTVLSTGIGVGGGIGDGAFVDRSTPVPVTGLSGVISLTAGGPDAMALRLG